MPFAEHSYPLSLARLSILLLSMLPVHRQALPDRYLLIPTPDMLADQLELERSLHRASRSDKPAIWLDFSLIEELSADATEVMLAYAYFLRQVGRRLVICHLHEALQESLAQQDPTQEITIVPTLLDVVTNQGKPGPSGPSSLT